MSVYKLQTHTPLKVHSGDIEDHTLQPQDHEETLRKWTVADTFSITARLKEKENVLVWPQKCIWNKSSKLIIPVSCSTSSEIPAVNILQSQGHYRTTPFQIIARENN